jgi:ribonuclease HI
MHQQYDRIWSLHIGLEAALELDVEKLDVYRDSILIFYQVKGEWQIKDEKLRPYQDYF